MECWLGCWRGNFPRRGRGVTLGMVLAGTLADADGISAWFGPRAFLIWHRTYTHSLLGTLIVVAIATFVALQMNRKSADPATEPHRDWKLVGEIAFAMAVAAIAHLLMDLCQSDGVTLLWPFSGRRFAGDLLPGIDAWILALLISEILVPELFRLVSSEIGARSKTPRGRNGARIALALLLVYVSGRALLHTSAAAELDAHAYKGESPRLVGAFPMHFPFSPGMELWRRNRKCARWKCLWGLDVPLMRTRRIASTNQKHRQR